MPRMRLSEDLALLLIQQKYFGTIPFFRSSGFPFLTVARNMSPVAAAGKRFSLAPKPCTAMRYKFFAPRIMHLILLIHPESLVNFIT